jgi:predicted RNA-binding protein with PUA-like domain
MNYWLMKTEPQAYSWQRMEKDGVTSWDGVRNFQANNNLKSMKIGDKCMFYHSGEERSVMGIVKVVKEFRLDKKDETGKFGMVDVEFVKSLKNPVSLKDIKQNPALRNLALIRQSRLSVMPVGLAEWDEIMVMAK